jgi:hypothetical protein
MSDDPTRGHAGAEAVNDDRDWFERHIHRNHRLREPMPFEFGGPLVPPLKNRRHVLVTRGDDREHVRIPIFVPIDSKLIDDNDEAVVVLLNENGRNASRA